MQQLELNTEAGTDDAGYRSDAVASANPGFPVQCSDCGTRYFIREVRPHRPSHICISCRGKTGRANSHARQSTPDSTKAERIRANGLVNKREKLGWFKRPKACMKCGRVARLDKHHRDYSKPGMVVFLDRACHMLAHRHVEFLVGVPDFDTSIRRDIPAEVMA